MTWPAWVALAGCLFVAAVAASMIWAAVRAGQMADNRATTQETPASKPGSLPPLTGPELANMRMDSMERRIAHLERRIAELQRAALVGETEGK